jgi:eukaryotic-like serine/threonine-protein kinase
MPIKKRFCPGCNEKYSLDSETYHCPQCGITLHAWADAPTVDLLARDSWHEASGKDSLSDELVGTRLGNYHIEAFCGQGGMASVYRATHLTLERPCAVKVLSPRLVLSSPGSIETFLAEARNAAALVHPHVVTIHTIGQDRGFHFIEMEFVEGHSLAHLADTAEQLEIMQATQFLVQISSALAAAHAMGLIHRDIKPANVLVTAQRQAKLADFGLAKRVVGGVAEYEPGFLTGTPYYMAPELFLGQPADKRSDVYAMGVTYFALCTHQLPYVSDSVGKLAYLHQRQAVPDIRQWAPHASDEVNRVIQRCLAKNPADRYEDAEELHAELRSVLGSLRELPVLLGEALAGSPVSYEGEEDRFTVDVPLETGRAQRVHVELCRHGATGEQVIRVFSICAPVSESYYQRALELNASISFGAVAIERVGGAPYFVMVNCHPRNTCNPEEVRKSIFSVARHADEVEHVLTGADRH